MQKLLHLVFAVWKTNRPFDPKHFPREQPTDMPTADSDSNDKAVGHKRDEPAQGVVTTADLTVVPAVAPVNSVQPSKPKGPKVDFAFLREQVTMEQVLERLGILSKLRARGQQRRGPCPIHSQPTDRQPTFSAHLGKNIFQCFHAECAAQGNVLDLWAAVHHLALYDAALHLAESFNLRRNREEEPVQGTRGSTQSSR